MIEVTLNIPEYRAEKGLQSIWENGFIIQSDITQNQIVINANKAGLISLAKQLLHLALDNVPVGSHYHFDDLNCLEIDSKELIISKI